METLVQIEHVTKIFPGVKALSDITFDIRAGEVHVLLGENGAGKSTLMKILSGVFQPTSGKIDIDGKSYEKLTPKESQDLGISIIYQELSLIGELSIMENMFVGKLPTIKKFGVPVVDYELMLKKASEALATVGLNRSPNEYVENLSISEKQQCEIAKAIVADSRVIIMDEPTTSLTLSETAKLFDIVRNLKKQGKGIVYISHKMEEIKQIGDRVTVLKDGKSVGTRSVEDVSVDDLIKMMVGREIYGTYLDKSGADLSKEPVVFEARHISRKDKKADDVSFQVHKKEILGFFGLIGSGRSELMNAIFGADKRESGEIFINGKEVSIRTPYDSIKNGLAMVTENRRETGFMHNFDIKQNISIVPFIKTSELRGLWGLIDLKRELDDATVQKEKLSIKCSSIHENITELSGGNQQKVIIGRCFSTNPRLVILDEPTRGVDAGARSDVYAIINELKKTGIAILLISSDMEEIIAMSDRVVTMYRGRINHEFAKNEINEDALMAASFGVETEKVG